jgi:pimeloyl-ACP methyl ester carboxylesterase
MEKDVQVGAPSGGPVSGAALHVVIRGEGPTVLLVHGSAVDHRTWTIQLASLRDRVRLLAYDRRGAGRSPLPEGRDFVTVEEHAADAAALLEQHGGGPAVACGSSFGGAVVLELVRQRPELLRAAALLEPPLPPSDDVPSIPEGFMAHFEQLVAEQGGEAAAEFFLRAVLGDGPFERMPKPFQAQCKATWRAIRQDCLALGAYRVNYARLGEVTRPVLLLGGEKSAPFYRATLEALHRALGNARLEIFAGAGHMLHADVYRRFNERLLALVAEVSPAE